MERGTHTCLINVMKKRQCANGIRGRVKNNKAEEPTVS